MTGRGANVKQENDRFSEVIYPELSGKTAVVTGAASGMGAVCLEELANRGVNVVGGDQDEEKLKTLELNTNERLSGVRGAGSVRGVAADVRQLEAHDCLLSEAVERFGGLDMWINSAGVFSRNDFLDLTPRELNDMYAVNVYGVFYGAQVAAKHFKENKSGSIVNIASIGGERARPMRAHYNSSKAAVQHLTNSMAVDLGPLGIRVNAVSPGQIDTPMFQQQKEYEVLKESIAKQVPLKRIGEPLDVFNTIYFLLSDQARYITGATISVDGGLRHVS